jgi:hypothetical protein
LEKPILEMVKRSLESDTLVLLRGASTADVGGGVGAGQIPRDDACLRWTKSSDYTHLDIV